MPIEPLRCKVCGGMLDANLKCPYCGALHVRVNNIIMVMKICPKHLIAYSANLCPKCSQEKKAESERKEKEKLEFEHWKQRHSAFLTKAGLVKEETSK